MHPSPAALSFLTLYAAFSQPTPTWTDKEVLIAIGSTAGALIPVALLLIRIATAVSRARLRKAQAELADLRKKTHEDQPGSTAGLADVADLGLQLGEARAEADRLLKSKLETEAQAVEQRQLASLLNTNLEELQGKLAQHQSDLEAERRRIQRALAKDGQTWIERVRYNAPEFKPLEPEGRRTPIIAVLNLKGGVGKTTITANLGAALDGMGYRVLLLDLDLQGSLTGLFLSETEQERHFNDQRLIGDFLASSFDAEFPNLLDYAQPILPAQRSGLVPTTDTLAYAETNLTIRWLLREGNRDPRFLLRRELQLRRVTNAFDVVLLDCPPLINVCCVNALAAADYVLVPVLPSKQATARVPILLQRLKQFRENINANLQVLGIVANRTHRSELTADEENRLTLLRAQCKDLWGVEVPLLETFIRQNAEVRFAEDENRPLRPGDEMYSSFLALAQEVSERMPAFCQPAGGAGRAASEVAV